MFLCSIYMAWNLAAHQWRVCAAYWLGITRGLTYEKTASQDSVQWKIVNKQSYLWNSINWHKVQYLFLDAMLESNVLSLSKVNLASFSSTVRREYYILNWASVVHQGVILYEKYLFFKTLDPNTYGKMCVQHDVAGNWNHQNKTSSKIIPGDLLIK